MTATSPLGDVVGFPDDVSYETVGDAVVSWSFRGFESDYANIRHGAAALDLSGAGLIALEGDAAEDLLQESFTRDVSYMTPERTVTGLILRDGGQPLDVVTVFRVDRGFLVQTSVGRGGDVASLLDERRQRVGHHAQVAAASERFVLIGVEGPATMEAVGGLLTEPVDGLPFQAVRNTPWRDGEVTVSRTGMTSEFGYTFLASWDQAPSLWHALVEVASPSGWESVEAAMVEVRQPLVHRELFEDDGVISAGLNWLVDLEKEDFIGRDGLVAELEHWTHCRLSVVSDAPLGRGTRLDLDGDLVGEVAHGVFSPSLRAHCGIARVRRDACASGLEFGLLDPDGDQVGTARSVSSPAVIPTSWHSLQG